MSSVSFPPSVSVTEQDVDISAFTETDRAYYLTLLDTLLDVYKAKNTPRIVIGLAGPTGAGKSLAAALLAVLAEQIQKPFAFYTTGIDAYHFPNEYLETHSSGGTLLITHKGAPETYDVAKLIADLELFRTGKSISLPRYSRLTHEPVLDAYKVNETNALLLLEGLWLLHDDLGWEQVRTLIDFSIFMEVDRERARETVIARHIRGGRTSAAATSYYDTVDMTHEHSVARSKKFADLTIPPYGTEHGTLAL